MMEFPRIVLTNREDFLRSGVPEDQTYFKAENKSVLKKNWLYIKRGKWEHWLLSKLENFVYMYISKKNDESDFLLTESHIAMGNISGDCSQDFGPEIVNSYTSDTESRTLSCFDNYFLHESRKIELFHDREGYQMTPWAARISMRRIEKILTKEECVRLTDMSGSKMILSKDYSRHGIPIEVEGKLLWFSFIVLKGPIPEFSFWESARSTLRPRENSERFHQAMTLKVEIIDEVFYYKLVLDGRVDWPPIGRTSLEDHRRLVREFADFCGDDEEQDEFIEQTKNISIAPEEENYGSSADELELFT
uniref:Uncharacterized protein n=1 Tax=Arion vulgaris TaxID=1028688 RepID=A0A0B6Y019_9EUPU